MTKIITVRTTDNRYLLQVDHPSSQWGFYLTDGVHAWDGGFDMGCHSWRKAAIPSHYHKIQAKLDEVKHSIEKGYGYPLLNRNKFVSEYMSYM